MIFSLFAKSNARSNGILQQHQRHISSDTEARIIPNPFEMHRANFDDMSHFLALQDAIPTTPSHSSNVEKLCTVDHVVVCQSVSLVVSESDRYT